MEPWQKRIWFAKQRVNSISDFDLKDVSSSDDETAKLTVRKRCNKAQGKREHTRVRKATNKRDAQTREERLEEKHEIFLAEKTMATRGNNQAFNLSRRETKQLQEIESTLRRQHRGKKVQFVLVEYESSDEIAHKEGNDSSGIDIQLDSTTRVEKYLHEIPAINTIRADTSEEGNFIVSADVHQVMDSMEGAVGGIVEPPPTSNSWKRTWHFGIEDEEKQMGNKIEICSDSSEELDSCDTAKAGNGWLTERRRDQNVQMKMLKKTQ